MLKQAAGKPGAATTPSGTVCKAPSTAISPFPLYRALLGVLFSSSLSFPYKHVYAEAVLTT